mgnify:CR=1 FL=1
MEFDKLICCDSFGCDLTEGEEYEIISSDGDRYFLFDHGGYMIWRFCTEVEWRSIKIERILHGGV